MLKLYQLAVKASVMFICLISLFRFKMIFIQLEKFNGLILLYCLTYKSISRVSGAYDHKMQKGKVLDL